MRFTGVATGVNSAAATATLSDMSTGRGSMPSSALAGMPQDSDACLVRWSILIRFGPDLTGDRLLLGGHLVERIRRRLGCCSTPLRIVQGIDPFGHVGCRDFLV